MPDKELSTSALIAAVFSRPSLKVSFISFLMLTVTKNIGGKARTTTNESHGSIVKIMIRAPIMVIIDKKASSGPWWASSVISKRSFVILDIMEPTLVSS